MCMHNEKKKQESRISINEEIAPSIYKMILEAEEIVTEARPGQFVNLYCKQGHRLLPRPISICEINPDENQITVVYAISGKGTEEFSEMKQGESIEILGPVGNGFYLKGDLDEHIIIGGGVGVPPLLELVKQLKGKKKVYLGFRSHPFLVEEFIKYGAEVHIATNDGSVGHKGTVMDLLDSDPSKVQGIYSCGPKPMLKAVAAWAKDHHIKAQLSLEERMGCGIGACVGCVCKIRKNGAEDWEYKKVCKDGPVFWSQEVVWDE